MKEIAAENITRITFTLKLDAVQKWVGYLLPGARLVSAEDATDDNWELLDAYTDYISIVECEDDSSLEACMVHPDDIHYACVPCDALTGGWGYVYPWAGSGLNSLDGEPEYIVRGDAGADTLYLS